MADTPKFALNSNPAINVTLPGFEKHRTIKVSSTYLLMEGDVRPRGFRSPSRYEEWPLVGIFWRSDRELAETFMEMLDSAYLLPDASFLMTPGGMQIGYADRRVEIHDYAEDIVKVAGITRVSFTATEVGS